MTLALWELRQGGLPLSGVIDAGSQTREIGLGEQLKHRQGLLDRSKKCEREWTVQTVPVLQAMPIAKADPIRRASAQTRDRSDLTDLTDLTDPSDLLTAFGP